MYIMYIVHLYMQLVVGCTYMYIFVSSVVFVDFLIKSSFQRVLDTDC